MSSFSWQTAGVTDRGLVRADNQDNYFISDDHKLLVVADGVGGAKGGALASRLAVEAMQESYKDSPPDLGDVSSIQSWLLKSVEKANLSVVETAKTEEGAKDMGTTIVAAVFADDHSLQIAHAGDSRAYLVTDGEAKVLTIDHSVVMEMHMRGQLTLEQARTNVYRHLITRCLGHETDVEVDIGQHETTGDGWLILASDGLSEAVHEEDIPDCLTDCESAQDACEKLLAKTMDGGAPDNVTIVVARFAGCGKPAKAEEAGLKA